MTKAIDKIMAGLDDARAYLNGDRVGFAVHEVEVPHPDVVAIRNETGLSQPAFARSIGIALGTLKNWEQDRRRPEGPARACCSRSLTNGRRSSRKSRVADGTVATTVVGGFTG